MNSLYHPKRQTPWPDLTLTRVVFELRRDLANSSVERYLTLTRVVFELLFYKVQPIANFHLTLTRVVFEFFCWN